jgi:hypothetical protein
MGTFALVFSSVAAAFHYFVATFGASHIAEFPAWLKTVIVL